MKLLDPVFGHKLPESAAGLVVFLVPLQALVQEFQDLIAGLNPGQFVSQTRMPAQLAADLNPITLALGRKSPLRTSSKTDTAGQASIRVDSGHCCRHLNGFLPAGLHTRSASRACHLVYFGEFGLQESEIGNLGPGAAIGAAGYTDGELVQGSDLPGQALTKTFRPARTFTDRFKG